MKPFSFTILLLSFLFLTNCTNRIPPSAANQETEPELSVDEPKTAEELRLELKKQEELAPLEYITDENIRMDPQRRQTRSAGLFRDAEYEPDGAIISGQFKSSATIARFKDVRLKLLFYSATNTLIEEKTYTIYKYIDPRSATSFSFKINEYPEAMSTFGAKIVGATAVN